MNTLSLTTLRSAVRSVGALPERALEKLRPTKLPNFLKTQAESLGDFLPYEAYMEFDRPTCLLADGSLGVIWELASLPHEVMSHAEIERRIGTVAEIMEKVRSPEATFQIIFDAESSIAKRGSISTFVWRVSRNTYAVSADGTRTPFQLMVSRAGDSVWLNPFDSETSAPVAVLASSGGGKSFFAQNMMMSFFAKEGRVNSDGKVERSPLLFVIDKKTSYEIFARVVVEDFGAQIIKPPAEFPNIFRGRLDEFRLLVIVGVLKTAISLVTENARVVSIEEMLLSQAVRKLSRDT